MSPKNGNRKSRFQTQVIRINQEIKGSIKVLIKIEVKSSLRKLLKSILCFSQLFSPYQRLNIQLIHSNRKVSADTSAFNITQFYIIKSRNLCLLSNLSFVCLFSNINDPLGSMVQAYIKPKTEGPYSLMCDWC